MPTQLSASLADIPTSNLADQEKNVKTYYYKKRPLSLCQAFGHCKQANKAGKRRKSERASERKTAERQKGQACKHIFK